MDKLISIFGVSFIIGAIITMFGISLFGHDFNLGTVCMGGALFGIIGAVSALKDA